MRVCSLRPSHRAWSHPMRSHLRERKRRNVVSWDLTICICGAALALVDLLAQTARAQSTIRQVTCRRSMSGRAGLGTRHCRRIDQRHHRRGYCALPGPRFSGHAVARSRYPDQSTRRQQWRQHDGRPARLWRDGVVEYAVPAQRPPLTDIDLLGVDLSTTPRDSIERIEITRGDSGAVLFGDGAVGGVIILSPRPARRAADGTCRSRRSARSTRASSMPGRGIESSVRGFGLRRCGRFRWLSRQHSLQPAQCDRRPALHGQRGSAWSQYRPATNSIWVCRAHGWWTSRRHQ